MHRLICSSKMYTEGNFSGMNAKDCEQHCKKTHFPRTLWPPSLTETWRNSTCWHFHVFLESYLSISLVHQYEMKSLAQKLHWKVSLQFIEVFCRLISIFIFLLVSSPKCLLLNGLFRSLSKCWSQSTLTWKLTSSSKSSSTTGVIWRQAFWTYCLFSRRESRVRESRMWSNVSFKTITIIVILMKFQETFCQIDIQNLFYYASNFSSGESNGFNFLVSYCIFWIKDHFVKDQ